MNSSKEDMKLYFLVEGNDDEDFIRSVIFPLVKGVDPNLIHIWKYREQKKEKVKGFLTSLNQMHSNFFYITDNDDSVCVTCAKLRELNYYRLKGILDESRIIVVIKEIESWYYAGMVASKAKKIGIIKTGLNANDVTKEKFKEIISKDKTRQEVLQKILSNFDLSKGMNENTSLAYFIAELTKSKLNSS